MCYNTCMSISEITKKSKKVFEKYHISKAFVFGSYAYGTAKKRSDVDILISSKKKMTIFDMMNMKESLSSALKKDVDVISEKGVLPEFKKNIYSKLIPIYGER